MSYTRFHYDVTVHISGKVCPPIVNICADNINRACKEAGARLYAYSWKEDLRIYFALAKSTKVDLIKVVDAKLVPNIPVLKFGHSDDTKAYKSSFFQLKMFSIYCTITNLHIRIRPDYYIYKDKIVLTFLDTYLTLGCKLITDLNSVTSEYQRNDKLWFCTLNIMNETKTYIHRYEDIWLTKKKKKKLLLERRQLPLGERFIFQNWEKYEKDTKAIKTTSRILRGKKDYWRGLLSSWFS